MGCFLVAKAYTADTAAGDWTCRERISSFGHAQYKTKRVGGGNGGGGFTLRTNPTHIIPGYQLDRLGRSEMIRTSDPLVPNEVRYQAALHSELKPG